MSEDVIKCKNCGNQFEGNFCNQCGQKKSVKRFAFTNLSSEFIHGFFHFHKGLLFTIKELIIRPGSMISEYLEGKRVNYFNPFTYMLLVSIVGGFFHPYSGLLEHSDRFWLGTPEAIEFTRKHFSIRLLIAIPVYGTMSFIFFRKANYNFAEHLIINAYMIDQIALIFTAFFILLKVYTFSSVGFNIILLSLNAISVVYPLYLYMQTFKNDQVVWRAIKSIIVLICSLFLNFYLVNRIVNFTI